jgi:hypothetical protein
MDDIGFCFLTLFSVIGITSSWSELAKEKAEARSFFGFDAALLLIINIYLCDVCFDGE